MAKKASLDLEFAPKQIEFFGDYFIVLYHRFSEEQTNVETEEFDYIPEQRVCPFIDVFERTGKPLKRVDISRIMASHSLELVKLR